MKTKSIIVLGLFLSSLLFVAPLLIPQIVLIPTSQPCNFAEVAAENAEVFIASRRDIHNTGIFRVNGAAKYDPSTMPYPIMLRNIRIEISLSDSSAGVFECTSIEQLFRSGKHSPTVWLTGHCQSANLNGCRYWLMIVRNREPLDPRNPNIISFFIFSKEGSQVAYGTGLVRRGRIGIL